MIPATNSFFAPLNTILYQKSKTKKILAERTNAQLLYSTWNQFIKAGKNYLGALDVAYEKDTPMIMVYSSGSTGASKGILLTNDGILATNYYRNIPSDPVKRQKTFLQMIPIWFSTGIVISVVIPLINGSTVIPELKFSKETFCRDLHKYKPNMTLTATSLWLYAVESIVLSKVDLSRMECPITGGEKVYGEDEQTINAWLKKHGCRKNIYKGYGMCELGGTVTSTSGAMNYKSKKCGTGYPLQNVIVSAFEINTDKELKYGQHGEIRVCSPARMKGYYKNPQATNEFFKTDAQGRVWGCTGDIGYVDEDGEVFVLGRVTDHYKRDDGKIVYLFDIEERVFDISEVNQCKVVDAVIEGKDRLVLHLVLREGVKNKDEIVGRVFDNLKKTLPEYMVPEFYKIRESMPVHSNGKRDVSALKCDLKDLKRP